MKGVKWLAAIIMAFVIIYFAGTWLVGGKSANQQKSAYYERVMSVERGDLEILVSANGVIEPINRVEIKSKASGRIEKMPIEEGDRVGQWGLIAELDRTDARNELEQARADLMLAEANLEQAKNALTRSLELFDKGLISAEEMDRAKVEEVRTQSQLVRAKAAMELAQERMDETTVRSPISGIVLTKNVEMGQIISSGVTTVGGGTLIATIADMEYVHVKAQVDEVDIGRVQPGQKAQVIADAFPDRIFTGEVVRVAPQGVTEQNITTFRVTILVKNDGGVLKSGMSTDVEVEIDSRKNVVMVPNESFVDVTAAGTSGLTLSPGGGRDTDETRVRRAGFQDNSAGSQAGRTEEGIGGQRMNRNKKILLVIHNGIAEPREVRTGISNFDYTEITEGLNEGDEIVIRTLSRARQAGLEMQARISGRGGFGGFTR